MKIKLPKTVNICGIKHTIEFPHIFTHDEDILGLYEYEDTRIKIAGVINGVERPVSAIYETLIHEMLHGVDDHICNSKIKHDLLTQVSLGWYQVLADNSIFTNSKIPNKLKVGGFIYDVEKDYNFEDENSSAYAFVNNIYLKIGLSTQVTSEEHIRRQLTYMITSAIICIYYNKDVNLSEGIIQNFATGIHQVFKDNKIEELIESGK